MKVDVNSLSHKELIKLRDDVENALATHAQRAKADAKKAAEEVAKKFGFSLGDLMGKGKGGRGKKGVAKYRNPADPSQTWSGRGRQPGWIKNGLAKGKKLADFAI